MTIDYRFFLGSRTIPSVTAIVLVIVKAPGNWS